MAFGTFADFKIYNEQFQAGLWEGITQSVDAFNAASRNAIQLVTESQIGHYHREAFFQDVANLITRRDITSTSTATVLKMAQGEYIGVKVDRKIGPVQNTLDSLRKIGKDPKTLSYVLGFMVGQKKAQDMLNTGIIAVEAAIEGQSTALTFDATGLSTKTLKTAYLANALAKMGDMASKVVCWVMHSKSYFDMVQDQIATNVTGIADVVVYGATPASFNRPVIVSDVPALWDLNGTNTDTYNVLGLVEGAVVVTESEQSDIFDQIVLLNEQITHVMQGEYAMTIGCKGFKWDIANGGTSPTDATLGTTTNWDTDAASSKSLSGVRLVVQ